MNLKLYAITSLLILAASSLSSSKATSPGSIEKMTPQSFDQASSCEEQCFITEDGITDICKIYQRRRDWGGWNACLETRAKLTDACLEDCQSVRM